MLSFKFEKIYKRIKIVFERIKSLGTGLGPGKFNQPGPGPEIFKLFGSASGTKKVGPDDLY